MQCDLPLPLASTQSRRNTRVLRVASTRCGWTAGAAPRVVSFEPCYGLGSQLEIEIVPPLLLATRLGRRLAFESRPWLHLSRVGQPPTPIWNYGCDEKPRLNDVFDFSEGRSSDVRDLSWGSTHRTSMDWACLVQARHPSMHGITRANLLASSSSSLQRVSAHVWCQLLPDALTDGYRCGGGHAFDAVAAMVQHVWSRMAPDVRARVDALRQRYLARMACSFADCAAEHVEYHAVHMRSGDKATESTSPAAARLFRATKHSSWWALRIAAAFGTDDARPVYIASDSCALALRVAAALAKLPPTRRTYTRCADSDNASSARPALHVMPPPPPPDPSGKVAGHVQASFNAKHTCDDVFEVLADVEMLARAVKLATLFSADVSLSNMLKLAVKLRSGVSGGSRRGVDGLRSVFNVHAPGESTSPSAAPPGRRSSMFDVCKLSAANASSSNHAHAATARAAADRGCFLDELIGLNYLGAAA